MGHVFISYFREDTKTVRAYASRLRRAGIDVWMDERAIQPGEDWAFSIRTKIEDADAFLVFLSQQFHERPASYVHTELEIALSKLATLPKGRSWFFPVLLDNITVPDLPISDGRSTRDYHHIQLKRRFLSGKTDPGFQTVETGLLRLFNDPNTLKHKIVLRCLDTIGAYLFINDNCVLESGDLAPAQEVFLPTEYRDYSDLRAGNLDQLYSEIGEFLYPLKSFGGRNEAEFFVDPGPITVQAFYHDGTVSAYRVAVSGQSNAMSFNGAQGQTTKLQIRYARRKGFLGIGTENGEKFVLEII